MGTLCLLLCCVSVEGGCLFRPISDRDVVGTYEATAQWGRSTLVLHSDHSFEQTVVRDDHTQAATKGTWKLDLFAGKNASHGIVVFKPFLDVAHDHRGDSVDGSVPSISRGWFGGMIIAADPDFGISFNKE
jgi:hypothetical protein